MLTLTTLMKVELQAIYDRIMTNIIVNISEMLRILLCNNYSPFTMDFWDYFKNEKNNKNP